MIQPNHKLALFMEGAFAENTGKMGLGVLRYSQNEVFAIVDSQNAGVDSRELTKINRSIPVVASVEEAIQLGAEVLILGIAPSGGRLPTNWWPMIHLAVENGLSIVNGLHDRVGPQVTGLRPGQFVWDVREEPANLAPATGAAKTLTNKRILTIGTDMAVGKMTAGLELMKGLHSIKKSVGFVATGQIGMTITGRGVPLDAIRLDFAPGAIEREVMSHAESEFVIVEGQGSVVNPASSANLPLIRGSVPTHLLMVHVAGMTHLQKHVWVKIPPLGEVVRIVQDLAELGGNLPRPEWFGTCVNTSKLTEAAAKDELKKIEDETQRPATDPIRFGVEALVSRLVN